MASISPLSFLSSLNASAGSSNSSSSSIFPPSQKPCHPSNPTILPKRHNVAKVACNANNQNPNGSQQPPQNSTILGNRRDILIGLGGLGAATFTYSPFAATAAPVAPDLSTCGAPDLPAGAKPTKCCPPYSAKAVDFTIPSNQPTRVRQPAHALSADSLAKYKEALRLMKGLPDDDPRSFAQQAAVHCAYCHNSYHQVGYPALELQVHNSWIFAPFHRWYIYFYERILGSLINDPTFALPFWNWDAPAGMEMPEIYTMDRKSPLYNALRNANHQPPTLIDLNWNKNDVDTSGSEEANLKIMYRQVYEVMSPQCFLGKPFRAGDKPYSKGAGSGALELQPHNIVHSWSGDRTQPNNENMGSLYSAGRDPLFYSHHANVDRMWSVWQSLGRKDFDDTDYLESSFLFYDENKNLVRVKTKDCIDSRKIGYVYEDVPLPWLDAKPLPRRTKAQRAAGKPLTNKTIGFPFTLNRIVSTVVQRPKKSKDKEESLVIEVQFDRRKELKFDVLINEEEDAKLANPLNREFVGSFSNVSHTQTSRDMKTSVSYTVEISNVLKDLEADDDDSIVVTLVPQYGDGVVINDIKIEECA